MNAKTKRDLTSAVSQLQNILIENHGLDSDATIEIQGENINLIDVESGEFMETHCTPERLIARLAEDAP